MNPAAQRTARVPADFAGDRQVGRMSADGVEQPALPLEVGVDGLGKADFAADCDEFPIGERLAREQEGKETRKPHCIAPKPGRQVTASDQSG